MWVHLPSSVSVQDTEELNSDYQPWETLSQSVTWKTTSRKPQFWQREWKKDSSLKRLSGVTLPPSTVNRGVAEWISSLEDSPVSRGLLQENNLERKTQGISGPTLPESHLNSDIQLSFLKMSPESLTPTTSLSDQSYKAWATELRKDSIRRRKQALRIEGNDFSLWLSTETIRAHWPSPTQRDYKGSPGTTEFQNGRFIRTSNTTGTQYGAGLDGAATKWRTPGANDANGGIEDWDSEHFKGLEAPRIKLNHQAANWKNFPTPNSMDHLPPRSEEGIIKLFTGHRKGRTTPSNLREFIQPEMHPKNWGTATARDYKDAASADTVPENGHLGRQAPNLFPYIHPDQKTREDGHTCSVKCRRLNPAFVSLLMGIPLNWSASSEATGMESFLRWRLSLGATLLRLLFRRSIWYDSASECT